MTDVLPIENATASSSRKMSKSASAGSRGGSPRKVVESGEKVGKGGDGVKEERGGSPGGGSEKRGSVDRECES